MGRTNANKKGSRRNPNEGTSARTRAFSFEEIMSRRRMKQNSTNEKDSIIQEFLKNTNDTSDYTGSDIRHGISSVKDFAKESFKKEESSAKKVRDVTERKYANASDLEAGMKVKSILGKNRRNIESTDEKYNHYSSKNAKLPSSESKKESVKKRMKNIEKDECDEYDEYYRKLKRDRKGDDNIDYSSRFEKDAKKAKKHESAKLRDSKHSKRKVHKKYHMESLYEDTRLGRENSRGLEYDRQGGRPASRSPLSQKHIYHTKDHGQSHKNNSKKKHSDGDRYKTSGNDGYSSRHHRKHGSGLGGYSPRKRKTEAAVKTPSPTIRSPERKVPTWDQLPLRTSVANAGSMFTVFPLTANNLVETVPFNTITPATTKARPTTSNDLQPVVTNTSIESVQLTQATRPMRRLYIENLPSSVTEKSVVDCLNEYLVSACVNRTRTIRPCISCIINKDKAQALVEFLTPEDATAALSFDGNSFAGSVLKMRRPKDFIEAASGVPEKSRDVRSVSDVVINSPYKIFVSGISDLLSSEMLMEIASAFGLLKAYHFGFNKELNGPCAFLEYEDHSITPKACAGLNGLMLGGCILAAVNAYSDANGNGKVDDTSPPSYDIPPHVKPLLADVTPVLRLQNVFNQEDLSTSSEIELEETLEDVRLECARFGTVKAMRLVRLRHNISEPEFKASEPSDSASESNTGLQNGKKARETSVPNNDEEHENAKEEEEEEEEEEEDEHANSLEDSAAAHKKDEDDDGLRRGAVEGSAERPAHTLGIFEPGSVLVEFQRREAARLAAHSLHGRSYGDRIVTVEYVPHNAYLERFPE